MQTNFKNNTFGVILNKHQLSERIFCIIFLIVRTQDLTTEIQRRISFGLTLRVQSMVVQTQWWEELDRLAHHITPTLKQNYMLSAHVFCLIPFGSHPVEQRQPIYSDFYYFIYLNLIFYHRQVERLYYVAGSK